MEPVRSDAIARHVVELGGEQDRLLPPAHGRLPGQARPERRAPVRSASPSSLDVALDNTAPAEGLPQIVIGPYTPDASSPARTAPFVSIYSPLQIAGTADRRQAGSGGAGRRTGPQRVLAVSQIPAQCRVDDRHRARGQGRRCTTVGTTSTCASSRPSARPRPRVDRRAGGVAHRQGPGMDRRSPAAALRPRWCSKDDDLPGPHGPRPGHVGPVDAPPGRPVIRSRSRGSRLSPVRCRAARATRRCAAGCLRRGRLALEPAATFQVRPSGDRAEEPRPRRRNRHDREVLEASARAPRVRAGADDPGLVASALDRHARALSTSPMGTRSPVVPWSTISGIAPTGVAIVGESA